MNELIKKLRSRIRVFGDACRKKNMDIEDSSTYINDIIYAAAEVYKNDLQLFMPTYNGVMLVYQEEDRNYIPLFTCKEALDETGITEYQEHTLKEICAYVYDNLLYYDYLANPELALQHGKSMSELTEYAKYNPKFEGIMLDGSTKYPFGLDGWVLQAVMFKGMGVNTFDVVDINGEVKYRL